MKYFVASGLVQTKFGSSDRRLFMRLVQMKGNKLLTILFVYAHSSYNLYSLIIFVGRDFLSVYELIRVQDLVLPINVFISISSYLNCIECALLIY